MGGRPSDPPSPQMSEQNPPFEEPKKKMPAGFGSGSTQAEVAKASATEPQERPSSAANFFRKLAEPKSEGSKGNLHPLGSLEAANVPVDPANPTEKRFITPAEAAV